MVNVKCILGYYDTRLERHVNIDEVLEVDADRAKQLEKAKVAVVTAAPDAPEKPAKKSRAKKEV